MVDPPGQRRWKTLSLTISQSVTERDTFAARIRATNPDGRSVGARAAHDSLQSTRERNSSHVMPARTKCFDEIAAHLSCLDLGRSVAAAEIRQRDRLLDVEVPVEHADDGLADIVDDLRAARRAESGDQTSACQLENE